MPNSSTLTETFTGASIDSGKFPNIFGSGASQTGGRLRLAPNNSTTTVASASSYTFDSAYSRMYPDNTAAAYTYSLFGFYADENNSVRMYHVAGDGLYLETVTGGVQSNTKITLDATAHAWWQLVKSGSNTLFQTSPDGTTWTTRRTAAHPAVVGSTSTGYIKYEMYSATAGLMEADNLNTLGATPGVAVKVRVGGAWVTAVPKVRVGGSWVTARPKARSGGAWLG